MNKPTVITGTLWSATITYCLCPSYPILSLSLSLSSSGFDEPDVECLKLAGLSAAPQDAPAVTAAKYTCHTRGGQGAVREFVEHILLLKKKAKSQMEQDRIHRKHF